VTEPRGPSVKVIQRLEGAPGSGQSRSVQKENLGPVEGILRGEIGGAPCGGRWSQ